jgi:hypothetical protein
MEAEMAALAKAEAEGQRRAHDAELVMSRVRGDSDATSTD